jgi:hypothetical protein
MIIDTKVNKSSVGAGLRYISLESVFCYEPKRLRKYDSVGRRARNEIESGFCSIHGVMSTACAVPIVIKARKHSRHTKNDNLFFEARGERELMNELSKLRLGGFKEDEFVSSTCGVERKSGKLSFCDRQKRRRRGNLLSLIDALLSSLVCVNFISISLKHLEASAQFSPDTTLPVVTHRNEIFPARSSP